MDCCSLLIKYALLIANLLFALAGLVVIGVGAHIQIAAAHYLDFLADTYLNTPIFIIIAGVVIFIIAFFGCIGAWRENACMVYTYAVCLIVILIGEVAAGIAALVLKNNLEEIIEDKMKHGMVSYGMTGYEGMTKTWDLIQEELQCCGSANYTDWSLPNLGIVPDSCCKVVVKGCGINPDLKAINQEGCFTIFQKKFVDNIGIVGGVAFGIGLCEIMGTVFACLLAKKFNSKFDSYY
jgi:CD63 antigen